MMDFYVDYSCEYNNETGRTKLTVSDFDTTSIRDVKYAIQAAIQAPVCDQQLFYRGQPVTDDDMSLSSRALIRRAVKRAGPSKKV